LFIPFTILKIYIPYKSQFEPDRIFLSTLEASKGFLVEKMKTIVESMVKKMLRMKAQRSRKRLKVKKILDRRASRKTLGKTIRKLKVEIARS
jgi:hypothetical protein